MIPGFNNMSDDVDDSRGSSRSNTNCEGYVVIEKPSHHIKGRAFLSVTVSNESSVPWRSQGKNPEHLSYHWLDTDRKMVVFEGKRSLIPEPGIPQGESRRCTLIVDAPPLPGRYVLQATLVREGICWFENEDGFTPFCLEIEMEPAEAPQGSPTGMTPDERARMTLSCRDAETIPKVADAGAMKEYGGCTVQIMHEGTMVVAGGYCGDWMICIIEGLRGHHEPQEELIFHHLIRHCRAGSLIVELGSFWAYYTNWYLGAVKGARAICLEPDKNNLFVGIENLRLNDRSAIMVNACVGECSLDSVEIQRESDGEIVKVPQWDFRRIMAESEGEIEMLHIDAQGAELPFIRGMRHAGCTGKVRFLVVSTHHHSISGSLSTHQDCLMELKRMGAIILSEHSVDESFSGDGLIAASFHSGDASMRLPSISKNRPEYSLFGGDTYRFRVETRYGPMMIAEGDRVIGESLATHGCFEEEKIGEVVAFLAGRQEFHPGMFIDIGANIGTHLVSALVQYGFKQGIGCEPDPLNFDLLKQNILINGLEDRTRVFNMALSDRFGSATLELSPTNFGDHRIRNRSSECPVIEDEAQRMTCSVMMETASRLFSHHGVACTSGTLVWIDTQGHEGHVLMGLRDWLDAGTLHAVVIEFWPQGIERSGGRHALFECLKNCTEIYDINAVGWQKSRGLSFDELNAKYEQLLSETMESHSPHTDLLVQWA
jgi:FkbM family methyltransferase